MDTASDGGLARRGWRPFLLGGIFVGHGLLHAASGMAAQDTLRGSAVVVATALFAGAAGGFVAAGLGVWGAWGLSDHWRRVATVAAIASALLLALAPTSVVGSGLGLVVDALVLAGLSARGRQAFALPERTS